MIKNKIKIVNINDIKPYKYNAKIHNNEQINKLTNIIKNRGYNQLISVDKNNVIVSGHGRLLALKKLNYKKINVIDLSHLSDSEIRKERISDNKINELSLWDKEILEKELYDIYKNIKNIDLDEINSELCFDKYELETLLDINVVHNETKIKEKEINDDIKFKNKCPKCGFKY